MKLRSVKVVNLDRSRLSLKRKKSGLSQRLILTDEMSKQAHTGKLQASPNYMKATSCSHSKRGSTSGDGSIEIRSAKAVKRIYSLKRSRKNSTSRSRLSSPKPGVQITMVVEPDDNETMTTHLNTFHSNPEISGEFEYSFDTARYLGSGVETSIHLTRSGSIKLNTRKSVKLSRRQWSESRFNQASIFRTEDEAGQVSYEDMTSDLQANDMEGTSSYYATKKPANNSVDAPVLKPARALWKIPSLKQRRLLIKKQSRSHEVRMTQFDHSTCSSTIKSTKFPQLDLDSGRYERHSTVQVCTYRYCSVHGNLHASSPPLFVSSKKFSIKRQKSRRRKYKSMTEKDQMQEVTVEDHAEPLMSETKNENVPEASTATDILLDKQTGAMWNMIYSHFLVQGNELTSEGNEKRRGEEDLFARDAEFLNYKQNQSDQNHDTDLGDQVAESENPEFNQVEAVDFAQLAVDEILLLDEIPRDLNGIHQTDDSENRREKENSSVMKFPKRQRFKGFQRIRKMIATTKFIKAMEKLRKKAHSGKETALLKHLSIDKRKGTEEKMLDVALQQVITKLDPDRQRRVTMLIEAFERVTQDKDVNLNPATIFQELDDRVKCYDTVATAYSEDHVNVEPTENVPDIVIKEDENGKESRSATDDGGTKSREFLIGDPHNRILEEALIITLHAQTLPEPKQANEEIVSYVQSPHQNPIEVCNVDSNVGKDYNFHFDKEKFTDVWNQVYRRFIGSEAIETGNEKNEGVEEKEQNEMKHDAERGSHLTSTENKQGNAIQLVQEAIDELLHLHEQLSDQLSSELCYMPKHDRMHNNEGEQTNAKDNLGERKKVGEEEQEIRDSNRQMPFVRQTSKAYTELRKMVVSANFIKAMEKVRKINPNRPQHLSLETGSEAERVYLRHWSMDERKTREEWMLDCALQEVITKLAPAQHKKVAILTQAFETFSSEMQLVSKKCFLEKPQPAYDTTSTKTKENEQQKSVVIEHDYPNVYKDDIQPPDDKVLSLLEDSLGTNIQQEDERNEAFDMEFDMQLYDKKVELSGINLHIHDQGNPKGCPVCYPPKFSKEGKEENKFNTDHNLHQRESPTDDSEHDFNVPKNVQEQRKYSLTSLHEQRSILQKESSQSHDLGDNINSYDGNGIFLVGNKYTNMWHLIYQQIKSGIPEKAQSSSQTDQHENMEIQDSNPKDTNLQQNDAIKLVQKAVDEILQMPDQLCDDQLIIAEDRTHQELPRSYKTVSKVILCKKFINAIEKIKKQRPKSIHLKLQKENEMNNDQLMLDFALQQVIGNLAPAQKKKVSLLVEAFERVTLQPEAVV